MQLKHRDQPIPCRQCGGTGKIYKTVYNPKHKRTEQQLVPCPACHGTGKQSK